MDRARAVVVAVVVVLAGCGGLAGDSESPATSTETLTPAPVPLTDPGETATPVDRPPGVTSEGFVDAVRLREVHESFLANRSYRWTLEYEVSDAGGDRRTVEQGFTRRAVVQPDRFLVEQVDDSQSLTQSLFVNDSGGYLQTAEGNVTRNQTVRSPGTSDDYVPSGQMIVRFLSGMNPDVSHIERGGRTYYLLQDQTGVPPALQQLGTTVEDFSVTAYVTRSGFVRSMTVSYERTGGTRTERVFIRFYYGSIGSARVERPAWVAELPPVTPTPTPPSPSPASGTATGSDTATPTPTVAPASTPTPGEHATGD